MVNLNDDDVELAIHRHHHGDPDQGSNRVAATVAYTLPRTTATQTTRSSTAVSGASRRVMFF
jgi:hypothetical protein